MIYIDIYIYEKYIQLNSIINAQSNIKHDGVIYVIKLMVLF